MLLLAVTYPTPDGVPDRRRPGPAQLPAARPCRGRNAALIGREPRRDADADAARTGGSTTASTTPTFVAAWLELMRHGGTTPAGNATGHLVESGYRLPTATGVVKVLSGEQSNSSVIVDDGESAAIVKFFRVLSEGQNPEVEIGAALTAGRTAEVPATLGWVTGEWETPAAAPGQRRPPGPRAANWPWRTSSSPADWMPGGWPSTRPAGGPDFTAEAHALGAATATVHRRLAEALGISRRIRARAATSRPE